MSAPTDNRRTVARGLLSGKAGPSRPDKELILARVLAESAPPFRWRGWIAAAASATLGVALLGLWLRPAPHPELVARGGETTPVLSLSCAHDPCQAGDALRFELLGDAPARYLAVLARREDGTVIWYFPAEAGAQSLDLSTDTTAHFVTRQVRIGADHPPGRYEVTAVFSPTALSRDEIRRQLSSSLEAGVVTRHLELTVQ